MDPSLIINFFTSVIQAELNPMEATKPKNIAN
jgi:hypothetical protein